MAEPALSLLLGGPLDWTARLETLLASSSLDCTVELVRSAHDAFVRLHAKKTTLCLIHPALDEPSLFVEQMLSQSLHVPSVYLLDDASRQDKLARIRAGAVACLLMEELTPELLAEGIEYALAQLAGGRRRCTAAESFQAMVENSLDIITVLNEDGTIRYESPSVTSLLGYEQGQLVGRMPFEYLHPDDMPAILELFQERVDDDGATATVAYRFRHRDGSWRTLESRAINRLDDPHVRGIIINSRDVTERDRAVRALAESEASYRALLSAIPDALTRIDDKGTYLAVDVAKSYAAFQTPSELLGRTVYEVLPKTLAERAMASVHRALETRETQLFEYEIDVDGEPRYREARVVAYSDHEIISIQRDITERKRAELALKESREQLRMLNHRQQDLLEAERTRIAREVHDLLGQSLTALRMDITWLELRNPDMAEGGQARLDDMKQLIAETVETVRRISRDLRPGVLDDLGILAALEWQAQEFTRRTDIACRVWDDTDLLELDREKSTALFRIFQELLTNVARHAEATEVDVQLRVVENRIELQVHDDGRGIRDIEIEDAHSLGLLGMRERVRPWDGTILLTGKPDAGTTVIVQVPLT